MKYKILITAILLWLLSPNPLHAQQSQTLFFDNFESGNLNNWQLEQGNWTIENGKLTSSLTGTAIGARINNPQTEWDNYQIELEVNNLNGIDEGIGFRKTNGDWYELNLRHGTGIFDTPEVKLYKFTNYTPTLLNSTRNLSLKNNIIYHLKITVFEENITLFINNSQIISFTDPNTQIKKGGLTLSNFTGSFGQGKVQFDNILVTNLNPSPSQKTPLLFIPGIGGSELKVTQDVNLNNHFYPQNEKVWVNETEALKPGADDYFDILKLKPDGLTPEANLELTSNIINRAYGQTTQFFIDNGYILNQDFFIFPYDWRYDLLSTQNLLTQKISQIKTQTNSSQIDLVAHSMGGLIAKSYIQKSPENASSVRKLITLGTPYLGSPNSLKSILYGNCINALPISIEPFCLGLNIKKTQEILENLPSLYQLLPSQLYYEFYDGSNTLLPYPLNDQNDDDQNQIIGPLDYFQTKDFLFNKNHNTSLFNFAENFHQLNQNLTQTNNVETTFIVGSGQPTIGQITEKNLIDLFGIKIPKKDITFINGDDTVPLYSASLIDPQRDISYLNSETQVIYTNQSHQQLVLPGPALETTYNILQNSTDFPQEVSPFPYQLTGQVLSVHSPINLHVYDQSGHHTGPTSSGFETQIPGSTYQILDDNKFIFLPNPNIYTLKFESTNLGSFDFKIKDFADSKNIKTTLYQNIPIITNFSTEILFDTSNPQSLNINNQQVTPQVLDQNQSLDTTPPITSFSLNGTLGENNYYKTDVEIILNSSDQTGISQTQYSIDNNLPQLYNSPFKISKEGTSKLSFKSIDNAGNYESAHFVEINIDKTPPEAKIIFNPQTQNIEIQTIDPQDQISEQSPGKITLIDHAGNTTFLEVEPKDKKRKEKLEIISIQYNNNPKIYPLNNKFFSNFKLDKKTNSLLELEQKLIIKDDEKLKTEFNQKKNQTKITLKLQSDKKQIFELPGLILPYFQTNLGNLTTVY